MRGTHGDITIALVLARFIPAHAGNTHKAAPSDWLREVHPRACGEHPARRLRATSSAGSSPRMRGTRSRSIRILVPKRFIPAHAGNTGLLVALGLAAAVHPRACGEHHRMTRYRTRKHGSSPRMRGTLLFVRSRAQLHRFIPAHAGNTLEEHCPAWIDAVHPRACGEHVVRFWCNRTTRGSSPRMRGTQLFLFSKTK